MPALIRVGHKGADAIVPGNTPASFDAALEAGVAMIEFDVLSERTDGTGELYVVHDYEHMRGRTPPTLTQALAHLAAPQFAGIEFDVDLKLPGYELRTTEALAAHGLLERSLISCMHQDSLRLIRGVHPEQRLGWSVPRVRRDYTTDALTRIPALAIATGYRTVLPGLAARALRDGWCTAVMAHWRLVTRRLRDAVAGAGGELFVWTVDDPHRLRQLEELGVTGVITNDPRLFGPPQVSEQVAAL